jgi:DNA modification methylase
MARLVEAITMPDQLVCDPFLGAGTTGVVCVRLARRFVGCDIDEKCVKDSAQRMIVEKKCKLMN